MVRSFTRSLRITRGIHNYTFITDQNDTLYQFDYFLHHLLKLPWKRRQVDNSILCNHSVVVEATKKLGLYEKIETPYIPLSCEAGIDKKN